MEKTKEYERAKIELIHLKDTDVISTSSYDKTAGDDDSYGWT